MHHSVFNFIDSRLSWAEWLEDLRGVVRNSRHELGISHQRLALDTNVLLVTIERFASGKTKRPHARTINEICRTLNALRPTRTLEELAPRRQIAFRKSYLDRQRTLVDSPRLRMSIRKRLA